MLEARISSNPTGIYYHITHSQALFTIPNILNIYCWKMTSNIKMNKSFLFAKQIPKIRLNYHSFNRRYLDI